MDEKVKEIRSAIETLIRCGIHRVQIPDIDVEFTSHNITIWIEQNLLFQIKELESKKEELEGLEKGLRNAIECDRLTIKRWEELFENAEERIKELEEGIERVINLAKVRKKAEFTSSKPEFWMLIKEEVYGELKKLVEKK